MLGKMVLNRMCGQIAEWFALLRSDWWSTIVVYILAFAAYYYGIWKLIEPLEIDKVEIFNSVIDRRLVHIACAFIAASHLTLLLDLINKGFMRKISASDEGSMSPAIPDEMISILQASSFCPEKKDLLVDRVAMKDGKMTREDFANRVLSALNCKMINERFARELLRGSSHILKKRTGYVFALVQEEPKQ